MQARDRVREFKRVPASQLRPHPRNWRVHPAAQRAALEGVLGEIGFAGAVLARQVGPDEYELIDGHLRAETLADGNVPVLVVDLSEDEAEKLLALHDPLAAMAERDEATLSGLLARVQTEDVAVRELLHSLAAEGAAPAALPGEDEFDLPVTYEVVAECGDEQAQRALYERLQAEGYRCRLLTLS